MPFTVGHNVKEATLSAGMRPDVMQDQAMLGCIFDRVLHTDAQARHDFRLRLSGASQPMKLLTAALTEKFKSSFHPAGATGVLNLRISVRHTSVHLLRTIEGVTGAPDHHFYVVLKLLSSSDSTKGIPVADDFPLAAVQLMNAEVQLPNFEAVLEAQAPSKSADTGHFGLINMACFLSLRVMKDHREQLIEFIARRVRMTNAELLASPQIVNLQKCALRCARGGGGALRARTT